MVASRYTEGYYNLEKKRERLRRYVNDLHFHEQLSKRQICRQLGLRWNFVARWTQSPRLDFAEDRRGWPKGMGRKWDQEVIDRVVGLHDQLVEAEDEFYSGASAVHRNWILRYADPAPPLRTIGQILKNQGRTSAVRKRNKGAAAYLGYPEKSLQGQLGRIIEADFIGPKYLQGQSKPLHFMGFSCKTELKLRWYQRIKGQTSDALLQTTETFFDRFKRPVALKVDNVVAGTGGNANRRL